MPRENKSSLRTKQPVTVTSTMSSAVTSTKKGPPIFPKQSSNVAKEITNVDNQDQKPKAKDILRLRYMRFRSPDIESTIDFYTTIGMNVDFKSAQELWVNPNAVKKRNTTNQVQGKSAAVEVKDNVIAPIVDKKAVVGFSFKVPGSKSMDPNDNIQIIFEKDAKAAPINVDSAQKSNAQSNDEKNIKTIMKNDADDGKEPHVYEYLVIYVHFLERVAKRLVSKGFKKKISNTDMSDIKMEIFVDPNGLEVRIMELIKEHLGEHDDKQKTWFARLAYYTVPTTRIEESVDFYEDTLNIFKKKETDEMKSILGIASAKQQNKKNSARLLNPSNSAKHFNQFRLVDAEEFVIGLTQTTFYWMANDTRAGACSICFTQKSDIDSKYDSQHQTNQPNLKLVSIGFHVSNLDASIARIKNETKGLVWEDNRYLITKVGIIARFLDKINNVWVELFTGKIPEIPKTKDRARIIIDDETFYSKLESTSIFYINKRHLKGHARGLSEGAIERVRKYMEEDEYLSPSKSEDNCKKVIKTPSCIF